MAWPGRPWPGRPWPGRPWPGRTKKSKSNLPAEAGKFDFLQYACRGGVGWGGKGELYIILGEK